MNDSTKAKIELLRAQCMSYIALGNATGLQHYFEYARACYLKAADVKGQYVKDSTNIIDMSEHLEKKVG